MNFIKKIFENKIDNSVHEQFTRFSIGRFENRALMKITVSKESFKLNTSYDLIKDITLLISENFDKIEAKGKVIYGKQKQEIDKTLSGEELKKLCEAPFILLNLTFDNYSVLVGKSLPKPGKALKDNFCKCILPLKLLKEFAFEATNFKKFLAKHTFVIEKIEIPKQYQNDLAMARKMAIRKGKIIREIEVDNKKSQTEINFEA